MGKRKTWATLIMILVLLVILAAAFLPCVIQDIPLEALMADSTMLPPGWQMDRTYAYEREDLHGGDGNLMRVWKRKSGKSGSIPTSFMMIER